MVLAYIPPLQAPRLSFGAAILLALYVALLIGFIAVTSHAPASTIIDVVAPG